jgi:hypothetical protein
MSLKTTKKAPSIKKNKKNNKEDEENNDVKQILSDTKIFTESQIEELVKIKTYKDDYLLNSEYTDILYEIIGGFYKISKENSNNVENFNKIIEYLKLIVNDEDFSVEDDDFVIIFSAPWFEKESIEYKKMIERLKSKITVKKGIMKCPDCIRNNRKPIDNTESIEIKNRGSDEPMSVKSNCLNCNYVWMIN